MHSNWRASPPHHHVRQAGHAFKLFSVAVKLRLEKQKPSYNCFPASPGPEKKKTLLHIGKAAVPWWYEIFPQLLSLEVCAKPPWKAVQHGMIACRLSAARNNRAQTHELHSCLDSVRLLLFKKVQLQKDNCLPWDSQPFQFFEEVCVCIIYFFFIYHWMVNALYILLAKLHRTWCKAPFNVAFRTLQAWVSLSTAEGCRTLKYFNLLLMTRQEKKKTDPKFSAFPINPKMGVINILHYSQWLVEKKTLHPASFFFFLTGWL